MSLETHWDTVLKNARRLVRNYPGFVVEEDMRQSSKGLRLMVYQGTPSPDIIPTASMEEVRVHLKRVLNRAGYATHTVACNEKICLLDIDCSTYRSSKDSWNLKDSRTPLPHI